MQHAVIAPDLNEQAFEASTRSSKEHEARVCRIVETCFPGHGLIAFERLYRSSWPVSCINRESLLLRDHLLLPKSVAAKVGLFQSAIPCCNILLLANLRFQNCGPGLALPGFLSPQCASKICCIRSYFTCNFHILLKSYLRQCKLESRQELSSDGCCSCVLH